ncbi:MAG TPA: NAD(P)-dependent oxidoreductase [Xanthobacteraceae bacterium]|jgi:phosphoglycerate dehydrogenase-like enzyme
MRLAKPVLVVEDDPWARLIGVVLDPTTSQERWTAFADFMSPDLSDFRGWCDSVRNAAGSLYPSEVRLVGGKTQLHHNLQHAEAIVIESLQIGTQELGLAPRLKVVHKYGMILRNIDIAACTARGVKVLSVRRRANIACAEHAFALMLGLARRIEDLNGLISIDRLPSSKLPYIAFDLRHTPGANWGRFSGMRTLNGSTVGIIGLGEIGQEIAIRAAAFAMTAIYFQRTRLRATDEERLNVSYRNLESLLAESNWVIPQLPLDDSTWHILNRERLAQMAPGSCVVNVSRAEVIDREALLEVLRSGRLGGLALDSLYEEPGRSDDELLSFENVILTPHMAGSPRFNGLADIEEVIRGLAHALTK